MAIITAASSRGTKQLIKIKRGTYLHPLPPIFTTYQMSMLCLRKCKQVISLTSKSCDLAKARTIMPTNFVNVIPLSTELPMRARASCARSMRDGNGLTLNALATCAQNSTEIPMHMMRLTKATAFNEMPHIYIRPNMSTTIIDTTNVIMIAIPRLKPRRMNVTMKMAPKDKQKEINSQ